MLAWIILLLGGLCEVGFVVTMKLSDGFRNFKFSVITVIFMIASFYSLSFALQFIPIGVGYAVWAGIGAVGSVIAGIIFFKESKHILKFIFISMIIIGIIGLKLSV